MGPRRTGEGEREEGGQVQDSQLEKQNIRKQLRLPCGQIKLKEMGTAELGSVVEKTKLHCLHLKVCAFEIYKYHGK